MIVSRNTTVDLGVYIKAGRGLDGDVDFKEAALLLAGIEVALSNALADATKGRCLRCRKVRDVSFTERRVGVRWIDIHCACGGVLVPCDQECICPTKCDCESPDINPALVSNLCPVHNLTPRADDECPWSGPVHKNGGRSR